MEGVITAQSWPAMKLEKKQKKNRRGTKGLNTRKKDGEEAVSIAQRGQKGNFARPQTRPLRRAITPSSVLNTAV